MKINLGKRHKQAVQVLNQVEYDENDNPIGLKEGRSSAVSANFGTERKLLRGGCYRGDGSAYIEVIGLLSTDSIEVMEGSDIPILLDDRIDINSDDIIFGVKIFRDGDLWAKFNCSENSGDIAYDSSGNGNDGEIKDAITTTPEEDPNSIHQYQDIYCFENEEGFNDGGLKFDKGDYASREAEESEIFDGENTIEVYVKPISITNSYNYIFAVGYSSTGNQISIGIRKDGNIYQSAYSSPIINFSYYIDLNNYYHLAIVHKNDTSSLYVNGDFKQEKDIVLKLKELGNIVINAHADKYSSGNNLINYIRLWNKALTEQELKANIKGNIDIADPNLILYYNNNIYNNSLQDETSNNYHAEIKDATLIGKYLPKDSSINLPPFKDVLGNSLQYVGKVPGKAKFVSSSCFRGDGNAYLEIDGLLTTDEVEVFGDSDTPTIPNDDELHLGDGEDCYGLKIYRDNELWCYLPLCEPIKDPSNHVYHDVSGNGNHATLINGTLANNGEQDEFHYLQRGFNGGLGQFPDNFGEEKRGEAIGIQIDLNKFDYRQGGLYFDIVFDIWLIQNQWNRAEIFLWGDTTNHYMDLKWNSWNGIYLYYKGKTLKSGKLDFNGFYRVRITTFNNEFKLYLNSDIVDSVTVGDSSSPVIDSANAHYILRKEGLETRGDIVFYNLESWLTDFSGEKNRLIAKVLLGQKPVFSGDVKAVTDLKRPRIPGYISKQIDQDLDALGNDITVQQDEKSFLNTESTQIQAYPYPALYRADKNDRFWFMGEDEDGNPIPRKINHYELALQNLMSDRLFIDKTDKTQ